MVDLQVMMMMMANSPGFEDGQQVDAAYGLLGSLAAEDDESLEYFAFAGPPVVDSEVHDDAADWESPCPVIGEYASPISRKLTHNAYERDRRKKLNGLYSSLRALLPQASLQKKLSIPSTVSHVLHYIPELQKQVQRLTRRKEKILLRITSHDSSRITDNKHNHNYPVVSAVCIGDREVMVQICSLRSTHSGISTLLTRLEVEGLRLLHSSTYAIDAGRLSCNLHLQVMDVTNEESQMFRRKLENIVIEELRSGKETSYGQRV